MPLRKLCLFFLSFVVCLLVAEGVFRIFGIVSTQDRENFKNASWSWPIHHFHIFKGPQYSAHIAHPFWGFTANPAMPNSNNMGFFDPADFPYRKKPKELVIGLFGGSVAQVLAPFLQAKITETLKAKLSTSCTPNIKVLNFSQAGHKQPSQFHIFSFFVQDIDMSVTLDGYNDAFTTAGRQFLTGYPLFYNELFETDTEKLDQLNTAYRYTGIQYLIAKHLHDDHFLFKSDLILWIAEKIFTIADHKSFLIKYGLRGLFLTIKDKSVVQSNIALWKKYILFQKEIATREKKKDFYFLQPNQYVKGGKILSQGERKNFFIIDSERVQLYEEGYEALSVAVRDLKKQSVNIFDYSKVFANESETLYEDDCCHLNKKGNHLLAEKITLAIIPEILRRHHCL